MTELKCPFTVVQAAGTCACSKAQEVIRRGGSEYDCTDAHAHPLCTALVSHLNAVALPALGHEDDLTLTPRSVYERILLGGLQGLRRAADPTDDAPETPDIWAAVDAARNRYPDFPQVPAEDVVPAIEACQLRKRRRR